MGGNKSRDRKVMMNRILAQTTRLDSLNSTFMNGAIDTFETSTNADISAEANTQAGRIISEIVTKELHSHQISSSA